MSWEIDSETIELCPCGEGNYAVQQMSDDWGRHNERWIMNCNACKGKYTPESEVIYRNGIAEKHTKWISNNSKRKMFYVNKENTFLGRDNSEKRGS